MQLGMISQPQIDQPQNFENEVFDWLPNFVKEGYNESITGMARELSIGKKPFDIENYEPKVYRRHWVFCCKSYLCQLTLL